MGYISTFKFDIFISYAHVDNLTAAGSTNGWVSQFHQQLEIQLWKRVGRIGSVEIWRDQELDGNVAFNKVIQDRIESSALFLALTSRGYQASEYCSQELKCFHRKAQSDQHGLIVGDRLRIFNILLNNVPHAEWPKEYGGSSGYIFHDAARENILGYPIDPDEKRFQQQLRGLVDSIYSTLYEIKKALSAPSPTEGTATREGTSFTIYVADAADSLRNTRKRLINDLEQLPGTRLVANIPPPYEPKDHEQLVTDELKNADLSVHLLDELAGREIDSLSGICYPQAQAELALAHSRASLLWVPQTLTVDSIEDEAYKQFLKRLENGEREEKKYDFIRGSPSTVSGEILEKVAELKARATQPENSAAAALLDTHLKDQLHALELSRFLLANHVQPYINPEEDDPRKNLKLFEERLKQVSLLIVIFGNVAREWVRARLGVALQIAIAENCPLKACGVYLAPPRKASSEIQLSQKWIPIDIMDNSEGFNAASLTRLLDRIKLGERS